jgi:hypothetical protein
MGGGIGRVGEYHSRKLDFGCSAVETRHINHSTLLEHRPQQTNIIKTTVYNTK